MRTRGLFIHPVCCCSVRRLIHEMTGSGMADGRTGCCIWIWVKKKKDRKKKRKEVLDYFVEVQSSSNLFWDRSDPIFLADEGKTNRSYNGLLRFYIWASIISYKSKTFPSLSTTIISWIIYPAARTRLKAGKCIRVKSCRNCLQEWVRFGAYMEYMAFWYERSLQMKALERTIIMMSLLTHQIHSSGKWTNLHNNDRFARWGYRCIALILPKS